MDAASPTFSALYRDASAWENPDPDYGTLTTNYGYSTACVDSPTARSGIVSMAARPPMMIMLVLTAEPNNVYVAHSLTKFPADITDTTGMDDLVVGLVGNVLASVVPVVLPNEFFTCLAANACYDVASVRLGHGAIPVAYHSGPHAAGAANTDEL